MTMLQSFPFCFTVTSYVRRLDLVRDLLTRRIPVRWGSSSYKRKMLRREEKKKLVFQYAGMNEKQVSRVYVMGNTVTGALGVRTFLRPENQKAKKDVEHKPYKLSFFDDNHLQWVDADCGYGFTVFVVKDKKAQSGHKLMGTGINTESQLGYQEYPVNSGRVLDLLIQPAAINIPFQHSDSALIDSISCGRAHTVVSTTEGVFTLGSNAYGQCGRPIVDGEDYSGNAVVNHLTIDDVTRVVCGQDHTLFLNKFGQVYSCGLGADGQTGVGHYKCAETPTHVKGDIENEVITDVASFSDTVLAVSDKGDVFGWGNSEYNQLGCVTDSPQIHTPKYLPFKRVGKVVKVAAGGTLCALLNDQGQVFVWGYGILGKGPNLEETDVPRHIPETLFGCNELNPDVSVTDIQCGISHFSAITNKGDLYTWGKNKGMCLGLGMDKDQYFPFKVSTPALVEKVCCGVDHTVALCKSFI